ncbi:MAG TPA: hypothetical protein VE890_13740 [Thermoguttaceae bacterium]|nr:hypothetical protein [Thermoguttaceae bacterium]
MSDSPWQNELSPVLRTMQIVAGALVAGCLTFLVVVLVVSDRVGAAGQLPVITYVAIGFACVALVVRMIVPGIVVAQGRRRIAEGTWNLPAGRGFQPPLNSEFIERTGDAGKLAMLFMTRMIIAAALLEGAAFCSMVAYMVEQSPMALIVAGVMIIGVALHFPTRSRLIHWIEDQLTLIEQER